MSLPFKTLLLKRMPAGHDPRYSAGQGRWDGKAVVHRGGDISSERGCYSPDAMANYRTLAGDRLGRDGAPNEAFVLSAGEADRGRDEETFGHLIDSAKAFRDRFYPGADFVWDGHPDTDHPHLHFFIGAKRRISLKELGIMRDVESWQSTFKRAKEKGADPEKIASLRRLGAELEAGKSPAALIKEGRLSLKTTKKNGGLVARPSFKWEGEFHRCDTAAKLARQHDIPALADARRLLDPSPDKTPSIASAPAPVRRAALADRPLHRAAWLAARQALVAEAKHPAPMGLSAMTGSLHDTVAPIPPHLPRSLPLRERKRLWNHFRALKAMHEAWMRFKRDHPQFFTPNLQPQNMKKDQFGPTTAPAPLSLAALAVLAPAAKEQALLAHRAAWFDFAAAHAQRQAAEGRFTARTKANQDGEAEGKSSLHTLHKRAHAALEAAKMLADLGAHNDWPPLLDSIEFIFAVSALIAEFRTPTQAAKDVAPHVEVAAAEMNRRPPSLRTKGARDGLAPLCRWVTDNAEGEAGPQARELAKLAPAPAKSRGLLRPEGVASGGNGATQMARLLAGHALRGSSVRREADQPQRRRSDEPEIS